MDTKAYTLINIQFRNWLNCKENKVMKTGTNNVWYTKGENFLDAVIKVYFILIWSDDISVKNGRPK